ncbi:hypothetical protein J5491_01665 [Candidatus Saccharibacteria bacterium]|nr:hypothetical protein [Candidatus Saccharibacteria bacterium]
MKKEFEHDFGNTKEPTIEPIVDNVDNTPPEAEKSNNEKQSPLLSEGEALLRKIGELPENHHIDTKYKLLFSTIDNTENDLGFDIRTRKNATFTPLGLEYKGKRHPYREDVRPFIHEMACNSDKLEYLDDKSLAKEIDSINSAWKGPFKAKLREYYLPGIVQEYQKEEDELLKEIRELEYKDSIVRKDNELRRKIEEEKRNKEKQEKKENKEKTKNENTNERDKEINHFGQEFRRQRIKFLNEYVDPGSKEIGYARKLMRNYSYSIGFSYYNKYRDKNSPEAQGVHNDLTNTYDFCTEMRRRLSRGQPVESPEEAKKALLEYLKEKTPNANDELLGYVKKIEEISSERYGEILPKYGSLNFTPYRKQIQKLREEKGKLTRARKQSINEDINQLIESKIGEIEDHIMTLIEPGVVSSKIGITTTGTISLGIRGPVNTTEIKTPYGNQPFSPLSPKVMQVFTNKTEARFWRETWNNLADENSGQIAKALWREASEASEKYKDKFDNEATVLLKEYQIAPPELFNEQTGEFHDSLQPQDVEIMKSILPTLGPFIKRIRLTRAEPANKEFTLKETRLSILRFLTGHDYIEDLSLVDKDGTVDIGAFGILLRNSGPDKADKAIARLTLQMGASIYKDLHPAKKRDFSILLGNQTNISEAEYYRIYREKVPNPNTRRQLIERGFFLVEFNKFLKKESSKDMAQYFEEIKFNYKKN